MSPTSKVRSPRFKTKDRRQKTKVFVILLFISITVFSCTDQNLSREGIVIADSKKYEASVYRQNCAICHGKEANGKIVDGKPVPSLRFGEAKKKTEEEIYQQIAHGKLPMPSFNERLTEKEIRRMVDFIMYDIQAREEEKTKVESKK